MAKALKPAAVPAEVIPVRHITSASDTQYLAEDLAKFIKEAKLCHNIQGKEYVNVEGWQYAGTRLGILPIVVSVERLETPDAGAATEIRYLAKVDLLDLQTKQVIGAGFAICSNKEPSKKFYQE